MLKIQGPTLPTTIRIDGFNLIGRAISETIEIPALAGNEGHQCFTVNSYESITARPDNISTLPTMQISLDPIEEPLYRFDFLDTTAYEVTRLSEQDKAELRTMIREVVTEVINEALKAKQSTDNPG